MRIVFICIFCLLLFYSIFAEVCPYGQKNDSFPGKCDLYEDSNNNGICDLSENPRIGREKINTHNNINFTFFKRDKYYLSIILPIYFVLFILSILSIHKLKSMYLFFNDFWNIFMGIAFLILFITSMIILLDDYNVMNTSQTFSIILKIHNIAGILFLLSILPHVYMKHRYFKKFFIRGK